MVFTRVYIRHERRTRSGLTKTALESSRPASRPGGHFRVELELERRESPSSARPPHTTRARGRGDVMQPPPSRQVTLGSAPRQPRLAAPHPAPAVVAASRSTNDKTPPTFWALRMTRCRPPHRYHHPPPRAPPQGPPSLPRPGAKRSQSGGAAPPARATYSGRRRSAAAGYRTVFSGVLANRAAHAAASSAAPHAAHAPSPAPLPFPRRRQREEEEDEPQAAPQATRAQEEPARGPATARRWGRPP